MYVGVPKNYGGTAFKNDRGMKKEQKHVLPPTLPHSTHRVPEREVEQCEKKETCENCQNDGSNPISCMLHALRRGKAGGISTEDFLLLGLIALLIGKEGNEDIVFILVMLLLL